MDLLLDTNLLIIYNRSNDLARQIEADYQLFSGNNNVAISIVSVGESRAMLYKAGAGDRRVKLLDEKLATLTKIGLNYAEILNKYIEIDAFSQGKHKHLSTDFSARNMGKNDLWIAATASALGLKLVTTDRDFDHLSGVFLDLEYVDFAAYQR